jgi:hypothetical protein
LQNHLSSEYVSPKFVNLLQQHQLASFSQLWNYEGEWFETPNKKRGGWSGVNYIELTDDAGQPQGFYLKRQEGYMRKTWRHPIDGEPTFQREFKILQFLMPTKVATPTLTYFAKNDNQAILMTAALAGFVPADAWLQENGGALSDELDESVRSFIGALALSVRTMHDAKVQHRALYLKHLFVKPVEHHANQFDVALIDFEKARVTRLIKFYRFSDLMKLWHRAPLFSLHHKRAFYQHYFNVTTFNFFDKKIFSWLIGKH